MSRVSIFVWWKNISLIYRAELTLTRSVLLPGWFLLLPFLIRDDFLDIFDRFSEGKLPLVLFFVSLVFYVVFIKSRKIFILAEDKLFIILQLLNFILQLIIFHNQFWHSSWFAQTVSRSHRRCDISTVVSFRLIIATASYVLRRRTSWRIYVSQKSFFHVLDRHVLNLLLRIRWFGYTLKVGFLYLLEYRFVHEVVCLWICE